VNCCTAFLQAQHVVSLSSGWNIFGYATFPAWL
jgi:hypothetical protein